MTRRLAPLRSPTPRHGWMRVTLALAATVLVLALPAMTEAQGCDAGLTPTPEGYCCWPGQRFAIEAGGCTGTPYCPAGTVASGNQCTPAVAPQYAVQRAPQYAVQQAPQYAMQQAPQYAMQQAPQYANVPPEPTPEGRSDAAGEAQEGFLFRTSLHAGYGHFLYLDSARNGGGPILGVSLTFAYRFTSGLYLGGSAAFDPILVASGWAGDGSSWGPLFTPGGYAGATVGYVFEFLEIDATIAFGGSGNGTGAGGFGLYVVPNVVLNFADLGDAHLGAILRPTLAILSDPNGGRAVLYPQITAGLSFTYR